MNGLHMRSMRPDFDSRELGRGRRLAPGPCRRTCASPQPILAASSSVSSTARRPRPSLASAYRRDDARLGLVNVVDGNVLALLPLKALGIASTSRLGT